METFKKTFVKFLEDGSFFCGTSTQEVASRNISKLKIPENVFAFFFFDIFYTVKKQNGKKIKTASKRKNESKFYHYGGTIYTLDEVKRDFPEKKYKDMVANAEIEGEKKMIRWRNGTWHYFSKDDVLIEFKPEAKRI